MIAAMPAIQGMINLLARGRNRDGLFQDGTEGGIARSDGVLEVADDEVIGCMFLNVLLFQCAKLGNGIVLVFL